MSPFVLLALTMAADPGIDFPELEFPAVAQKAPLCQVGKYVYPLGLPVAKTPKELVPLLIEWAFGEKRLPGQPPGDNYPDAPMLRGDLKEKLDVIYISWSVDGRRTSDFQWKYEVSTGKVKPLTHADCRRLTRKRKTGALSAYGTAHFGPYGVQELEPGDIDIQFRIGLGMAGFVFQKNEQGKYVVKEYLSRGVF